MDLDTQVDGNSRNDLRVGVKKTCFVVVAELHTPIIDSGGRGETTFWVHLILVYPLCSENWRDTKSTGVGETSSVGENKTFLVSHHTGEEGRRCSQSHSQQLDFQEF